AHPRTFGFLRGNIELNRRANVEALNFAVGAGPGTLAFSDRRSDDQNAVSPTGTVQVRAESLDTLLERWPEPIRLLKIDVEGFEKFVFEGAPRVLERTACIYYESCARLDAQYGYSPQLVLDLLRERGFEVVCASGRTTSPIQPHHLASGSRNFIAVR